MRTKTLLMVTALLEAGTGVALLAVPSWVCHVLLNEELATPQSLIVARIAGAALAALAVVCWLMRTGERHAQAALLAGLLVYNLGVPVLLLHGRIAWSLGGALLWPAIVLHTALAVWCLICLRSIH